MVSVETSSQVKLHSNICVLCFMLIHVWLARSREGHPSGNYSPRVRLSRSVIICSSSSRHTVNECRLVSTRDAGLGKLFILLATAGHCALLPLLFTPQETPIKILLLIGHSYLSYVAINHCLQLDSTSYVVKKVSFLRLTSLTIISPQKTH
jgi:ABC-type uncharacterized transport system permease subunit